MPRKNLTTRKNRRTGQMCRPHPLYRTTTYNVWANMKQRCTNPKFPQWKDYGGRGITVCDRWLTFANFVDDMGERPGELTLDRLDNSKGYSKENCAWRTRSDQAYNRREAQIVHNGKSQHLNAWARETGLHSATITGRLERGWSLNDALTVPGWSRRAKQDPVTGRFMPRSSAGEAGEPCKARHEPVAKR